MSDFKCGNIVRLASGGPRMTVGDVRKRIECLWFEGATLNRDYFNADELVHADAPETGRTLTSPPIGQFPADTPHAVISTDRPEVFPVSTASDPNVDPGHYPGGIKDQANTTPHTDAWTEFPEHLKPPRDDFETTTVDPGHTSNDPGSGYTTNQGGHTNSYRDADGNLQT